MERRRLRSEQEPPSESVRRGFFDSLRLPKRTVALERTGQALGNTVNRHLYHIREESGRAEDPPGPVVATTPVAPATMTCSEFIESYSEYYDRETAPDVTAALELHMASCEECRRYNEVFDRGRDLVRSLPELDVPDDFLPRLKHRIYHIEDGNKLAAYATIGSGTTAVTVLTMAIILVAVAWSPSLFNRDVDVELSPIVVSQAPTPAPRGGTGIRAPKVSLVSAGDAIHLQHGSDVLRTSNSLLYRYSSLAHQARQDGAMVRAGLD